METDHVYTFISEFYDVDFARIEREAPSGVDFIIVESKDRITGKPQAWALLVHNNILNNDAVSSRLVIKHGREYVKGYVLGPKECVDLVVSPTWGQDSLNGTLLNNYRLIGGEGKFPGFVKQHIEGIRRLVNPKQTETRVTYA